MYNNNNSLEEISETVTRLFTYRSAEAIRMRICKLRLSSRYNSNIRHDTVVEKPQPEYPLQKPFKRFTFENGDKIKIVRNEKNVILRNGKRHVYVFIKTYRNREQIQNHLFRHETAGYKEMFTDAQLHDCLYKIIKDNDDVNIVNNFFAKGKPKNNNFKKGVKPKHESKIYINPEKAQQKSLEVLEQIFDA
jgi:hypothetical protein